jgi:Ser/Thr protein kinase RdoA (MazF antagonist)
MGVGETMGSAVESIDVITARQRTYSRIFFCQISLKDGRRREVVLKIYEPWPNSNRADLEHLLAQDFEITSYLNRLLAGQSRFLVPTPLFHSPKHLLIVTAYMPGVQLQEKLEARARWFPDEATRHELESDCHSCGEWLREFQAVTREKVTGLADVQRMRQMIADRLEWSIDSGNIPINGAQRGEILAYFDRIARNLTADDLAVSGVHGDFFPGNLLVARDQVVGLDFVMYREGSIYADPSYFVLQLETLAYKLQFRRSTVARLCRAFLQGYNPSLRQEGFFSSRPMLRLYFIFHQAMRLGRMLVLKDEPLHRSLNNRRIASDVVSRLSTLASQDASTGMES